MSKSFASQTHLRDRFLAAALFLALALLSAFFSSKQPRAQSMVGSFSNGFSDGQDFFPIGVWLQNTRDARAYAAMGVNTFVGLWQGPTETQLAELAKAGMHAIAEQNEVGLTSSNAQIIKAWMHGDEPDNAQPLPGGGHGDCILPNEVVSKFAAIRSRDPTRPVFLNFGQGVVNEAWRGRGSLCSRIGHDAYYRAASRGADILSFDIYPITEHRQPHVQGRLELVAGGVANLKQWSTTDQRVWAIIGTTHIYDPKRRPTPAEIRAMAWMAIVRGARGLVYFVHEWQPSFSSNAIFRYPEISAAVTVLNSEIRNLAPVINSQQVVVATADPSTIAAMARIHNDTLYVFAANLSNNSSRPEITIDREMYGMGIVLGEARSVRLDGRIIRDEFAPYGVHLYVFSGK